MEKLLKTSKFSSSLNDFFFFHPIATLFSILPASEIVVCKILFIHICRDQTAYELSHKYKPWIGKQGNRISLYMYFSIRATVYTY